MVPNYFLIRPSSPTTQFDFSARFSTKYLKQPMPGFNETQENSKASWQKFWLSGGAVDFSQVKDKRAFEIERRTILSQYLTKIQCSSDYPPQETGLTYNSWYGKPHLEMHWWHAVHFTFQSWGNPVLVDLSASAPVHINATALRTPPFPGK